MVACNSHQTTPRSRARDQLSQFVSATDTYHIIIPLGSSDELHIGASNERPTGAVRGCLDWLALRDLQSVHLDHQRSMRLQIARQSAGEHGLIEHLAPVADR